MFVLACLNVLIPAPVDRSQILFESLAASNNNKKQKKPLHTFPLWLCPGPGRFFYFHVKTVYSNTFYRIV